MFLNSEQLLPTFKLLAADPCPAVRRTIAASLQQLIRIIGKIEQLTIQFSLLESKYEVLTFNVILSYTLNPFKHSFFLHTSKYDFFSGSKFSCLKDEIVGLFCDCDVSVLACMVTNMVYVIDALARFGVLQVTIYPSIFISIYLSIYIYLYLYLSIYLWSLTWSTSSMHSHALDYYMYLFIYLSTGDFMKKLPTATCALRDR